MYLVVKEWHGKETILAGRFKRDEAMKIAEQAARKFQGFTERIDVKQDRVDVVNRMTGIPEQSYVLRFLANVA